MTSSYENITSGHPDTKMESWHSRYWTALHQEDSDLIESMFLQEIDMRIRKVLARRITNQEMLYSIATENSDEEIQIIAINNIYDKSYLVRLRMVLDPQLQPYVMNQVMKMRKEERF